MVVQGGSNRGGKRVANREKTGVVEPVSDIYIEDLRQWKVSSGVGSFRLKVLELRADGKAR